VFVHSVGWLVSQVVDLQPQVANLQLQVADLQRQVAETDKAKLVTERQLGNKLSYTEQQVCSTDPL
jgi:uncharacterized protein YlxW (UPF0749 family)